MSSYDLYLEEQQKKKSTTTKSSYDRYLETYSTTPAPKPSQVAAQEQKKPSLIENIKTGVGDFFNQFTGKKKIEEKPKPTEIFPAFDLTKPPVNKEPNLFDFAIKEANQSAQFTPETRKALDESRFVNPKAVTEKLDFTDKLFELARNPENLGPFVKDAKFAKDSLELLNSVNKIRSGSGTEDDAAVVKNFLDKQKQEKTIGYQIIDTISQSIPFAAELYVTGGTYNIAKEGAVKGLKWLSTKAGRELLEKDLEKWTVKLAVNIAARTAQVPVTGAVNIAATTISNQAKSAMDARSVTDKESWAYSLTKAASARWVDHVSEFAGGAFDIKYLPEVARNKIFKNIIVTQIQKLNPLRTLPQIEKLFSVVGYDGVLGEMFEERVADVGHGILNKAGIGDQPFKLPSKEQLLVEAVAFSVPGITANIGTAVFDKFSGSQNVIPMSSDDLVTNVIGSDFRDTEAGDKLIEIATKAEADGKSVVVDLTGEKGEKVVTPNGNTIAIEIVEKPKEQVQKEQEIATKAQEVATPSPQNAPEQAVKSEGVQMTTEVSKETLPQLVERAKKIEMRGSDAYQRYWAENKGVPVGPYNKNWKAFLSKEDLAKLEGLDNQIQEMKGKKESTQGLTPEVTKITAKDLVESKNKKEITDKLEKIFGTYKELDELENVDTYENPNKKLAIAEDYMADIERAANDRDYEETSRLLKEVYERQKEMEGTTKESKPEVQKEEKKTEVLTLDQEGLKNINPKLFREAQKAKTVDEFITKMSDGKPETISKENLTEFYNRVKPSEKSITPKEDEVPFPLTKKEKQELAKKVTSLTGIPVVDATESIIKANEPTLQEESTSARSVVGQKELSDTSQLGVNTSIDAGINPEINGGEAISGEPEIGSISSRDTGVGSTARTGSDGRVNTIVVRGKKSRQEINSQVRAIIDNVIRSKGDYSVMDPENYTEEDKALFRAYSGEGGLGGGNLSEFYTPNRVVKLIYQKLREILSPESLSLIKTIVEPSVGTGRFIKYSPFQENLYTGYEIDQTAAVVSKVLYPESNIQFNKEYGFSNQFIKDRTGDHLPEPYADLVVGNPPYGEYSGLAKGLGEGKQFRSFEEYFIARGLDILREGGIEAYVVQSTFLRSGMTTGKDYIASKGKLIAAYRLPNKTFSESGTTVGTDIVFFQRRPDLRIDKETDTNDRLEVTKRVREMNEYFDNHPENVYGVETEKQGRFGMEKYIEGDMTNLPDETVDTEKIVPQWSLTDYAVVEPKNFYKRITDSEGNVSWEKVEGARKIPIFQGLETFITEVEPQWGDKKDTSVIEALTGTEVTRGRDRKETIDRAGRILAQNTAKLAEKLEQNIKNGGVSPRYTVNDANFKQKQQVAKAKAEIKQTEANKKILKDKIIKVIKSTGPTYTLTNQAGVPNVVTQGHINTRTDASVERNFMAKVSEADKVAHFSYADGRWYLDNNYTDGINLYDRLDQLEEDRGSLKPDQYKKQHDLIIKSLPVWSTTEEIGIEAASKFWEDFKIENRAGNSINVRTAFSSRLGELPNEVFEGLGQSDIMDYLAGRKITGWDEQLNAFVAKNRMRVANKLFRSFLTDVNTSFPGAKEAIENGFNHRFNAYKSSTFEGVPITGPLNVNNIVLNPAQRSAIGFNLTKGKGIDALDVGVGKTIVGVITLNETFHRGWGKAAIVAVPNASVGKQWISEATKMLPSSKIYDLTDVKNIPAMAGVKVDDKSIVLVTEEGMKRIGLTDESYNKLEPDIIKALINPDLKERDLQIAIQKLRETVMGTAMKSTSADVTYESLGIDVLMIDEAHNYNHVVAGVPSGGRARSEYSGLSQNPSSAGIKAYVMSQYIQSNNGNRNTFLLTATPVSNSPLEYYSMYSMIGKEELQELGILNVKDFIESYMAITNKLTVNASGQVVEGKVIDRFVNFDQFQQLQNKMVIRIDGEEAGVQRPNKVDKNVYVNSSREQYDMAKELSARYVKVAEDMKHTSDKELKKKLLGERLRLMGAMVGNSFSQYATAYYRGSKPDYKAFVDNSPKIKVALDSAVQNIKDNKESNSIVYSSLVKNDHLGINYFNLMKEYLIKVGGLTSAQIGIIGGTEPVTTRAAIQKSFNEGKTRIILGSAAILEGLNLQAQTTDMYVLTPFWNYTAFRQLAGRGWRQGNKWSAIRMHRLMSQDTGDVFITQKLLNKELLDKQANDARKTGKRIVEMAGDTIEFEEVLDKLITDPEQRLTIRKANEVGNLVGEIAGLSSKLSNAEYLLRPNLIPNLQERVDSSKKVIEELRPKIKILEDKAELIKDSVDQQLKMNTARELEEIKGRFSRADSVLKKAALDIKNIQYAISSDNINQETLTYYRKLIDEKKKEQSSLDEKYKKLAIEAKAEKESFVWTPTDFKSLLDVHKEENKTFFVKAKVPGSIKSSRETITPSGNATVGKYGTVKHTGLTAMAPSANQREVPLRGIQFPEMVALVKQLTSSPISIKAMKRALGKMYEKGEGMIRLTPKLFEDITDKGIRQLTAVLQHEVGHLADYIPDSITSRGNLIGHIASLNHFMKGKFEELSNKDIRQELKDLTQMWNPFNETKSKKFTSYRYSSKELYADALSVLLNDPALLQRQAPKFYQAFFEYLHEKPSFEKVYFDTMELLNEGETAVEEKRMATTYKGYEEAAAKRKEIEKEKRINKPFWERFMQNQVTTTFAGTHKLSNIGTIESNKQKTREALEEYGQRHNDIRIFLDRVTTKISNPLATIGLTEADLGFVLERERESLGDRLKLANPEGAVGLKIPKTNLEYWYKKKNLTPEQRSVFENIIGEFHNLIYEENLRAYNNGIIGEKMWKEKIEPNKDTYATFSVVHYIHKNYISAAIKKQVGTVSSIENPFVSTMLKTVAMIEWNNVQEAKGIQIQSLLEDSPNDITKAKARRTTGGRLIGFDRVDNREVLRVMEKGVIVGYHVDPYIAKFFSNTKISGNDMHTIVNISRSYNGIFKKFVITWNLGFALMSNPLRDIKRTYINLGAALGKFSPDSKGLSIGELLSAWVQAIPTAKLVAKGELNDTIREMLKDRAFSGLHVAYDPYANEDSDIAFLLRQKGILPELDADVSKVKELVQDTAGSFLKKIEYAGGVFEATTKIAGFNIVKKRIKDGHKAGFLVRNYVGTPNYMDGGAWKQIDNEVFIFSNVMIQAARTSVELGVDPKTASGYWFRTFLVSILPAIIQGLGIAGLFGEWVKKILEGQTEYKNSNFTQIPVGVDENGKGITIPIPGDNIDNFFHAIAYKLTVALATGRSVARPEQLISTAISFVPGETPILKQVGDWFGYFQGRNPYDDYRGRLAIEDYTWRAGGITRLGAMVKYSIGENGLFKFKTYDSGSQSTLETVVSMTPVINRMFSISNYGITERLNASDTSSQKNAQEVIAKRELVAKYIKLGRDLEGNDLRDLRLKMVSEYFGGEPKGKDQLAESRRLDQKFLIDRERGQSPYTDALINTATNEGKLQKLLEMRNQMRKDDFVDMVNAAWKHKIISDDLMKELKVELKKVEETPKKTSFLDGIVKPAIASEEGIGFTPKQRTEFDSVNNQIDKYKEIAKELKTSTLLSPVPASVLEDKVKELEVQKDKVVVRAKKTVEINDYFKKHDAPLSDYAETYVDMAEKYNIDPRIPAILSFLETSGGKPYDPVTKRGMTRKNNPGNIAARFGQEYDTMEEGIADQIKNISGNRGSKYTRSQYKRWTDTITPDRPEGDLSVLAGIYETDPLKKDKYLRDLVSEFNKMTKKKISNVPAKLKIFDKYRA